MEVEDVLDVDRVEEDEGVVVAEVDGREERLGVVGDEIDESLQTGVGQYALERSSDGRTSSGCSRS